MRKSFLHSRSRPPIGFIILPMIDVIFLLLLFFVMVTSFEATARIRVDVPRPDESQARNDASPERVVINCEWVRGADAKDGAPAPSARANYRVGADPPEDLGVISRRLSALKAANPQLTVVVRADRRLPFAAIREVMQVIAENGIVNVSVSAIRGRDR